VIASCSRALQSLHVEVNGAPWFAALGEPLTDNVRALAADYGGTDGVTYVRSWREAEDFLKSSATSLEWWDHEEDLRKRLLAEAEAKYPGQALWTALTDLTTEAGDLVHGKAAAAAASLGGAQPASIHVAAGAASQAIYQLAVARLAGAEQSPFENKFRLFVAGRWPLGISGAGLVLF